MTRPSAKKTGNPAQADTVSETGMPLLSKHFTMAEGFVANALNQPVICNGKYWGIVSITFNLADFVVNAMPPEYDTNVFILRADDGFFVYSNRRENNYRSVLKDPKFKKLYPQFAELGRQILAEPMGKGDYQYKNAAGENGLQELHLADRGFRGPAMAGGVFLGRLIIRVIAIRI